MLYISKSGYCSAIQCPKMLWLKKNHPELFDDSLINQMVLDSGIKVGEFAMGLFGRFTEVPYGNLSEMISETKRLLDSGTEFIAEASFSYNGQFCSVDILKNWGGGKVEIYEVKSSTKIRDIYLHDVAFQNYVLTKLGFAVDQVSIVHIDNTYTRIEELELGKLFKVNDITEDARALYSEVEKHIRYLEVYMQSEDEPVDDIGLHCFSPYACGFFGHCSRFLASPNVFDVAGMQKRSMFKHYLEGTVSFEDLEYQRNLNPKYLLQISHELHDMPCHVEKDSITDFLSNLFYPIYFLDFETVQPAIPLYECSKPYEQIVFQYSLHFIESEGGELRHKEYFAYPGEDPRRKLAEQLCQDIPLDVCTLAYHMAFEKGRLKSLAALYPDLAEHLMNIHDNIHDLMIPFRQKNYYCKAMQGSYSIKYVLPALFPDNPDLDYQNLEGVQDGMEASATFINMENMTAEEIEESREHLLKYCELDTYAMVKIWEKLHEAVR